MWLIVVVALVAGGVQTGTSPIGYATNAECTQSAAKLEQRIQSDKDVKAYAIKCVEFTPDEVRAGGVRT